MKRKKYMPYNFDIKYEYKTYKNIGKQYKLDWRSKRNLFYKIYKLIRKFYNRNEKKYANFDTYSLWREYIKSKMLISGLRNYKDFIHFIKGHKRSNDYMRSCVVGITSSVYMVIVTCLFTGLMFMVEGQEITLFVAWIVFSITIIAVMVVLCIIGYWKANMFYFFKDILDILKEN